MITIEHEYYIRFILLLLEAGTDLLREILEKALQKKGETLDQFLKSAEPALRNDRCLTQIQKDTLYPQNPQISSIKDFDITLLSHLLIKNLKAYIDNNEKQGVKDIRDLRNNYHAHAAEGKMNEATFRGEWNQLATIIRYTCNGLSPDVQKRHSDMIANIEKDQLDITAVAEQIKKLDQSMVFFQNVQTCLDVINKVQEELVGAVESVKTIAQNTDSTVENIKIILKKSEIEMAGTHKDVLDTKEEVMQMKAMLVQIKEQRENQGRPTKEVNSNVLEVLLYLKSDTNKSVNEKLLDAGLVLSTVSEEDEDDDGLHPVDLVLPEDKEWDVHVTYISSTTESVMLRLVGEEYSDKLDNFQAKLQEAFRNSSAETPLQLDRTYIAYDDGLYHRVRVISQDEKRVQCYFFDHGDADELLPEQLHPIDPQINKLLPYQAVEVSLYGLEEVSSNITALEKICDLALDKTCVAEVVERKDISSVILYDTSGDVDININEMILRTIEAEGGGIGSSSSTPKRVLSPAISASDVTSSTSDQRASASDLKSSLNDVQSNTLASQSNVVSKSESNRKVDHNSNPLYSDLNSDSVPAVERLTNSLQNNKIQDDYYNPSLQRVSPLRQSTNDTVDAGYNTSDMLNSSSQQSISRPILGRSPGGAAAGAAAGAATGVCLEGTLPRPFKIPPVGEFLDVHISFVHDPSNFVCLPYHEINNLNMLLMDMLDFYSAPIQHIAKSDIEVGKLYAGHKDEVWYRVKVSALVGTDLVSVYLVDIGEYSVMMISELRPLVDQFRQLPMMAINACLGSITPESGSWYESAKYLFIKLAREKDLVGLVQGCDEKTGIVNFRLIDTSNDAVDLCIDEVLVKKQFARHKDK